MENSKNKIAQDIDNSKRNIPVQKEKDLSHDSSEERKLKDIVDNKNRKYAENAVPPDAWENQQKAYNEAWENNKNQALEDDI
ncbi:hypothetical protein FNJ88_00455 [Chryseobacterium sp. SNU WT5]|uniref:hypothetical protein n=1 Tax=Chryseobacterium sp. SNU WT5 TaxID=2594269 RepID=UPI00117DADD6|nr:hypothetical protein [Chryseobacterium sp. SNU WT5]QDP84097.1 hypothetical protein FNJ88_00455 [Chryseobacterium sp. SNU WT5]